MTNDTPSYQLFMSFFACTLINPDGLFEFVKSVIIIYIRVLFRRRGKIDIYSLSVRNKSENWQKIRTL